MTGCVWLCVSVCSFLNTEWCTDRSALVPVTMTIKNYSILFYSILFYSILSYAFLQHFSNSVYVYCTFHQSLIFHWIGFKFILNILETLRKRGNLHHSLTDRCWMVIVIKLIMLILCSSSSGGLAGVWLSRGHRFNSPGGCPSFFGQNTEPHISSWCAGQHLEWQPLPSLYVCMNYCKLLWTKVSAKCP